VKILVLVNLYPPHHAGTYDLRCQNITEGLKLRGQAVRVLTSNHGLGAEQRGAEVERRLWLNGVYEHPRVTNYRELRALELHNHQVLRETLAAFEPDLIHVFSLAGLSHSLIFTLRHSRLPTVYDVADFWISQGLREDPWLRWWNRPGGPLLSNLWRACLEGAGQRNHLDRTAPTRMMKGYERLPEVYGAPADRARVAPNSIPAFRFDRLYFCSLALRDATEQAGFRVNHGEIIYPGIPTQNYVGEIKPPSAPLARLLVAAKLEARSGVMTAVQALHQARDSGLRGVTLSIYGRGETEYVAELRSYIALHQLPVEFLPVSNLVQDLPQVLRRHDALLHTPEWNEPFSATPLEAMASGVPVIGAGAGGAVELLRHGENALIYTPGDAAELAFCLQELHQQPELRGRLAEAAQQEVLSKYNETAVMDRIENYLQTSLEVWAHTAS
jgi:glycosyltransferase involved in cell wall biosynthesis